MEFLETFWAVRDSPETGWAVCVGNYALNRMLGMHWAGNGRGLRVH